MTGPAFPDFDPYMELEVDRTASAATIDAAWKSLVKRHHPDTGVTGGDDERIKRLNLARDWLVDPALRARYDAMAAQLGFQAGYRSFGTGGRSPAGSGLGDYGSFSEKYRVASAEPGRGPGTAAGPAGSDAGSGTAGPGPAAAAGSATAGPAAPGRPTRAILAVIGIAGLALVVVAAVGLGVFGSKLDRPLVPLAPPTTVPPTLVPAAGDAAAQAFLAFVGTPGRTYSVRAEGSVSWLDGSTRVILSADVAGSDAAGKSSSDRQPVIEFVTIGDKAWIRPAGSTAWKSVKPGALRPGWDPLTAIEPTTAIRFLRTRVDGNRTLAELRITGILPFPPLGYSGPKYKDGTLSSSTLDLVVTQAGLPVSASLSYIVEAKTKKGDPVEILGRFDYTFDRIGDPLAIPTPSPIAKPKP